MPYTIGAIVSEAFTFNDSIFTYNISGAVTTADVGKAVTIDPANPSTMKLVAAGERILGRLETYEDRVVLGLKVGAVARRFKCKFPAAEGHGITVGKFIVGGAAGLVALDTSNTGAGTVTNPIVVEVGTDYVVAEQI